MLSRADVLRTDRTERASALFLYPAFIVIFLMMAALVVDLTVVFLAERDAADAAISAASAGATAVDEGRFRSDGTVTLDAGVAAQRAEAAFAADSAHRSLVDPSVEVAIVGPNVTVTVRGTARPVFLRAAGSLAVFDVDATATANPEGPPV